MNTTIDLLSDDPKVVEEIKSLMSAPDNFKKGPSVYFHHKAIECARNEEFLEDRHLEYIYATLASWGMHRMGDAGAKMPDFEDYFKKSILTENNKEIYEKWRGKTVDDISDSNLTDLIKDMTHVCFSIEATEGKSKLVSSSKTLAHILPDLVPPIDRQYTLQFFYGTKNHPINTNDDGQKVFEYVMRYMYDLYRKNEGFKNLALNTLTEGGDFCSSLPKIFDNLVINCVRKGITLKKIV
jgi:hypothetical protein